MSSLLQATHAMLQPWGPPLQCFFGETAVSLSLELSPRLWLGYGLCCSRGLCWCFWLGSFGSGSQGVRVAAWVHRSGRLMLAARDCEACGTA